MTEPIDCNCGAKHSVWAGAETGHAVSCPAHPDANYFRAHLRKLLHDQPDEPPAVPCPYCQSEPHEWCEYDCGSPFPILHPAYRDARDDA